MRRGPSQAPVLLLAVPLSALTVAALVMFFAPTPRVIAARVIGGPTDDAQGFRGRVQIVEEVLGTLHSLEDYPFSLRAEQDQRVSVRTLRSGPEGWVEFALPRYPGAALLLQLNNSAGESLVQGAPALSARRYAAAATQRSQPHLAHQDSAWAVCVDVPSGVLAVPFVALVTVRVLRLTAPLQDELDCRASEFPSGAVPLVRGALQLTLQGATIALPQGSRPSELGPVTVEIKDGAAQLQLLPHHHTVRIEGRVSAEGMGEFGFVDSPAVVPGACWFREVASATAEQRSFELLSPVQRAGLWYTFVSPGRRGPGGYVSLSPTSRGLSQARLDVAAQEIADMSHLLLASDADGRSASAVGLPLEASGATLDAWDAYLLDGLGQARARALKRARQVRAALLGYAAASILLTLLLFVHKIREVGRDVDARMQAAGADANTYGGRSFALVLAVLCVFFAFSATLVWIVAR